MENFLSSLTFLLTFLMIFISFKWISSHSKMKKKLPPSPWKFPLIGNLHQLGSGSHRSLQGLS
ncbi:putative cytochrome P450 superfamily [Helianthus annuus]|nr:putative cytochrome P450 superfamily [Helianthus annuus]